MCFSSPLLSTSQILNSMETGTMSSISSIQQVLIDHLLWVVPGALGNIKHGKTSLCLQGRGNDLVVNTLSCFM